MTDGGEVEDVVGLFGGEDGVEVGAPANVDIEGTDAIQGDGVGDERRGVADADAVDLAGAEAGRQIRTNKAGYSGDEGSRQRLHPGDEVNGFWIEAVTFEVGIDHHCDELLEGGFGLPAEGFAGAGWIAT